MRINPAYNDFNGIYINNASDNIIVNTLVANNASKPNSRARRVAEGGKIAVNDIANQNDNNGIANFPTDLTPFDS